MHVFLEYIFPVERQHLHRQEETLDLKPMGYNLSLALIITLYLLFASLIGEFVTV